MMPIEDLPQVGLGTYSNDNREQWAKNVQVALDVGYRAIDTAQVYGNEQYIGEGIATSSVDRDDIFLSTKTVHVDVPPNPDKVSEAIDSCLDRLGVEYVDLLYVHWPSGIYDHETILPAFDEAYETGKTRYIGLSNFTPELLDEAREVLDAPLAAHQVEMHPLFPQEKLLEYAQEHGLWQVAYCPLGQGNVFSVSEIREVAQKHNATPAQVSIAWLLSKGNVAAIPKASSEKHMRDNLAAQDFKLDRDDIVLIDSIEREQRILNPDYAPWN